MKRFLLPVRMNVLSIIILSSALCAAESAGPDSWPQWGGPTRDFHLVERGLTDTFPEAGPTVLWRREIGDGYSGMVVGGEGLFTLQRRGDQDVLIAIDTGSGRTIWQLDWEAPATDFMDTEFGPGPHATPLLTRKTVFAVGGTGRLVAVDRQSGRLVWQRELWSDLSGTPMERGYAASPVAFGDLVIVPVGGTDQALMAFDQQDGSIVWQAGDFDIAYSSPILIDLDGETQLVALLKTEIVGMDPATGRRRWLLPVTDERYVNVVTPLFTEGNLLFFDSSEGGRVLQLSSRAGETEIRQLWLGKVMGSQVGNVARIGDHLYGTLGRSAASFLTAVDIRTGERAWRTREVGDCSILVVGEMGLMLESDGTLRIVRLSPAGLETMAQAKVLEGRSWTAPTLAGTTLFLRNRREMVALDLAAVEPTNP